MNEQPAWQLCPKCNGEGEYVFRNFRETDSSPKDMYRKCKVCNGKMIISTMNGLPPGDGSQSCAEPEHWINNPTVNEMIEEQAKKNREPQYKQWVCNKCKTKYVGDWPSDFICPTCKDESSTPESGKLPKLKRDAWAYLVEKYKSQLESKEAHMKWLDGSIRFECNRLLITVVFAEPGDPGRHEVTVYDYEEKTNFHTAFKEEFSDIDQFGSIMHHNTRVIVELINKS